ncbi:MAG: hypothetical protein U5N86_03630 [Planctomycetota bacterium]|nr:hypothetical protein [Planctomycetota bacterium]
MIKKFFALATILALLAVVFAAPAPRADELPENSFAKFLPENTLFYMEADDISASYERMKELALYKMITNPEMKLFFDNLAKMAEDEAMGDFVEEDEEGEPGEEKSFLEKFHAYLDLLNLAASGKMYMAVTDYVKSENEMHAFMAMDITQETKPHMVKFIQKAIDDIQKMDEEVISFNETINEVAFTVIGDDEDKKNENLYIGITDKHAVFAFGKKSAERFLHYTSNPPEKSLHAKADFVDCYKNVASKEMFFYTDVGKIFQMADVANMAAAGPQPQFMKKFMDSLMNLYKGMGAGVSFQGRAVVDELYGTLGKVEWESIQQMGQFPCSFKSASLMPKDAMLYAGFSLPMDALYNDIIKYFGEAVQGKITEFENLTMLSMKDEIVKALGNEVGLYAAFSGLSPNFLAVVEVRDAVVVNQIVSEEGLAALFPGMQFSKSVLNEADVFTLAMPGGPPMALTVYNDWLMFGTLTAVKDGMLRQEPNSLQVNENFRDSMAYRAGMENISSMFFLDTKAAFSALYDNAMPFAQSKLAQNPNFDPAAFPSKDAFVGDMIPMVFFGEMKNNAFKMRSAGPVPYSVLQIMQH